MPSSGDPPANQAPLCDLTIGQCISKWGLPLKTTQKLQLDQNAEMQRVMGTPQNAYVTPLLCELHWLIRFLGAIQDAGYL